MPGGWTERLVALSCATLLAPATVAPGQAASAAEDPPRLSSIADAEQDIAPGTPACFPGALPGETQVLTCDYGHRGPRLLVIGDSHMRALSPAFRRLAEEGKIRATLITRSRCGWSSRVIENDTRWIRDDCQTWRANVQRYIRAQKDVRAIITHHRASPMAGTHRQRGPDTVKSWRVALDRQIPVIVIAGSPIWPSSGPMPTECLRSNPAPRQWKNCAAKIGKVTDFDWTVSATVLARRQYGPRAAFRIDMNDTYCPERICPVVTPRGQIMYRDHQHLTAAYTRSLAPLFAKRLRSTGVVFGKTRTRRERGPAGVMTPRAVEGWSASPSH